MKRSEALAEIKVCGYHGNYEEAAIIQARKGIGQAAVRKAFMDGVKSKQRKEVCECPICTGKEKK